MWYIWGFFGRFEIARVVFLIQLLVADFLIWYELTAQGGISWPVLWKLLVSFGGCSVATACSCRKSVVFLSGFLWLKEIVMFGLSLLSHGPTLF